MQKDSYAFPEKQAYRQKLLRFLQRNHANPSNVKVACFPGHEGLEIKEVYDVLGVPRKNIVGIEFDPRIARGIKSAVPGIDVVCSDAADYFGKMGGSFDIINLDFQGHLRGNEFKILCTIFERGILACPGTICTNFYGCREAEDTQKSYESIANIHHNVQELFQTIPGLAYKVTPKRSTLQEWRSDGITSKVMSALIASGRRSFFKDAIENTIAYSPGKILPILKQAVGDRTLDDKCLLMASHSAVLAPILHKVYHAAMMDLPEFVKIKPKEVMDILDMTIMAYEQPFMIKDHERYSYSTSRGCGMMMADFLNLNREWYKYENNTVGFESMDDHVICHFLVEPVRDLHKKVNKFVEGPCRKFIPSFFPSRERLEGAPLCEVSSRRETIGKEDVLGLLRSGCTPEEITDLYDGFSIDQLRAFKAHITMGTYKISS